MWRKRQRDSPGPGRRDLGFLSVGINCVDGRAHSVAGQWVLEAVWGHRLPLRPLPPLRTVTCRRPRLHVSKWGRLVTVARYYKSGGTARLPAGPSLPIPDVRLHFQVWVIHLLCYFNISPSSHSTFSVLFIKTVTGLQIDSFPLFRRKIPPLKNFTKTYNLTSFLCWVPKYWYDVKVGCITFILQSQAIFILKNNWGWPGFL